MLHQRCELVAFRAHIFSCAATIFCLWTLRIATQQLKARGPSTLLHSVRLYYAIPCDAILFDVVLYYTMLLTTCRCMVAIVQTRLPHTILAYAIRCYTMLYYTMLRDTQHCVAFEFKAGGLQPVAHCSSSWHKAWALDWNMDPG